MIEIKGPRRLFGTVFTVSGTDLLGFSRMLRGSWFVRRREESLPVLIGTSIGANVEKWKITPQSRGYDFLLDPLRAAPTPRMMKEKRASNLCSRLVLEVPKSQI